MSRSVLLLVVASFVIAPCSTALAQVTGVLPGLPAPNPPAKTPQVIGLDDDDQAAREKLHKRISADWLRVKLSNAVEALRRELDVQFQLDPEGLEEAGVTQDEEISVVYRDRRGDQLLNLMLTPLHLTYVIKDGVVQITSEEKAAEQLVTRAYNVRDLLEPWSPKGKRSGGASPLPVPEGTQVVWSAKGAALARAQYYDAIDELIDLISSTVDPDTWTDNGGSGSISIFRGLLIVSQTEATHNEVEILLRQIRAGEHSQPGDVIHLPY